MPLFVVSCFFFRCLIAFRFCHSCDLESFIPLASRELSYLNIDRLHHVMWFMLCFMPSLTNYWNCCYITLIFWASLVTQVVKNTASMGSIPGLGRFPREGNGTHSSVLVWKIPWTEEPVRLQFMGSQRVGHNCVTNTFTSLSTLIFNTWFHHLRKIKIRWQGFYNYSSSNSMTYDTLLCFFCYKLSTFIFRERYFVFTFYRDCFFPLSLSLFLFSLRVKYHMVDMHLHCLVD